MMMAQRPLEDWPEGKQTFHRFITRDDPTFEEYPYNPAVGYVSKTPDTFAGLRKEGTYKGSRRVMFTMPCPPDGCTPELLRTIELLKSNEKDNPSFGAVQVQFPLGMEVEEIDVDPKGMWPMPPNAQRMVVISVNKKSHAADARIQKGDIIRAISVPEPVPGVERPWWQKALQGEVPASVDGIAVLDGLDVSAYDTALDENMRVNGNSADIVFVIERPANRPPDKGPLDDLFGGPGGGFPALLGGNDQMQPATGNNAPLPGGGGGGGMAPRGGGWGGGGDSDS